MLVSMGPSDPPGVFGGIPSGRELMGLGIEKWDFNGISYGVYNPEPVCIPKLPSYSKKTSGKSEGESPHDDHSGWWIRLFFRAD